MKNLLTLLFVAITMASCSNQSDSAISAIKKELGKAPDKTENISEKCIRTTWEGVGYEKMDILKNAMDKTMKILPTKTQELTPEYDYDGNRISGEYFQFYVWETSTMSAELSYHFSDTDSTKLKVVLYNTLK